MRRRALLLCVLLCVAGCFSYERSAKRWSYAGNVVLMMGGGGAIAGGVLAEDETCTGPGCPREEIPISGAIVAGSILVITGLVGIVLNATRPVAKQQSR